MCSAFDTYDDADWYDRSVNWQTRLERELPVLTEVFGQPGDGGLIDAGCGTGRQAIALARVGYRMIGADASDGMLEVARRNAATEGIDVRFAVSPYDRLYAALGGGHDGLLCVGNALAAAGSRDAVAAALAQFRQCVRPGGRLFVQVLNFPPMRQERPCVRGPRVTQVDGVEYVSVRTFHFEAASLDITNVTLWREDGWKVRGRTGTLYPVDPDELVHLCQDAGFDVDELWQSYARKPFDPAQATDLIVVATRSGG